MQGDRGLILIAGKLLSDCEQMLAGLSEDVKSSSVPKVLAQNGSR